jgi:tetratricopeptide (TPR) repeat protein
MVAVLSDAAAREPADGKVRLYLGNLLAGLGRYDEAVAAWTAAVERDASLVVGARNLGMEAWKRGARLDDAIRWLERAHRGAPSDQVVSRDLAQVLVDAGRPADALAVLRSLPADRPRADVVTLLARTLVSAGLEDEAIERLSAVRLSNWEGNTDVWRAFVNAHLARGERRLSAGDAAGALADFDAALTYPPNLGVGGPARPETARVNFWRGRALSALGRREEARQAWSDGAARLPEPASAVQREFEARSDRALQALGRR